MGSKIGLNLTRKYSINFDLPKRNKNLIKFIIIHYTGMKKESDAIKKLCSSKSKVSSHYFIRTNGELLNLVPDLSIILPVVWALLQSSSISSSVLPVLQELRINKEIKIKRDFIKCILIKYCIDSQM